MQPVEILAQLGPALEAPARGQRDQLDAPAFPVTAQFVKQAAQAVRAEFIGEQAAHLAQRQRLRGTDQRGLKDALGILGVHERKCALNQAKSGKSSGPGALSAPRARRTASVRAPRRGSSAFQRDAIGVVARRRLDCKPLGSRRFRRAGCHDNRSAL